MANLLSWNVIKKQGEFVVMGLKVKHNGKGRVVITDANNENVVYSDEDYYSPADVEGIINNIIETKWGKKLIY